VCSAFLASLEPGAVIHAHPKEAILRSPKVTVPIVMVANGAGVGVFRGYLEHWKKNERPPYVMLFYGCRGENEMAYAEELREWERTKHLDELHIAFSREIFKQREYVQQLLPKCKDRVLEQLETGYLYLCGGPDMCKEVIEIVTERWKVERSRIVMEPWTHSAGSRSSERKEPRISLPYFGCCG